MQTLLRELWRSTGTTVIFVTHNTHEALHLGTRVVVLAKDSPDQGAREMLDLQLANPCCEEEIPRLVNRLESASRSIPSLGEAVAAIG
jgi:NitT/TauT family transport system ATP-binding protein